MRGSPADVADLLAQAERETLRERVANLSEDVRRLARRLAKSSERLVEAERRRAPSRMALRDAFEDGARWGWALNRPHDGPAYPPGSSAEAFRRFPVTEDERADS
jgi:hypothetical protein